MAGFLIFILAAMVQQAIGTEKRLLMDDMAAQMQKMADRLSVLESCMHQRGVAFTATMANHQTNIALHEVLKFDNLVTNEGNGFNAKTGIFRAPYAGVYVFDLTIGISGNSATDTNIVKNGTNLLRVYGHASSNWETSSGSVSVHLNQGDDVYAVIGSYNEHGLIGHGLTTFSGYMVQPDCALG